MSSYSDNFFQVSSKNGFLPIEEPLRVLPGQYQSLQDLLDDMPVRKRDGSPGLLATKDAIVERVLTLPNLNHLVVQEQDKRVLCALYRGYTFLTSAYLLEKAYHEFKETGKYGKARRELPENVAVPLWTVSQTIKAHPWLDYSYAYALGNWYKRDPSKGMEVENLELAVAFAGTEDEHGFILDHVEINSHGGDLIQSYDRILDGLKHQDREEVIRGLKLCEETMKRMNEARMWKVSKSERYNDFRVFIMGVKGNTEIFDDGVLYNGVDDRRKAYIGQSGSLDSIIVSLDILSRVKDFYPDNELTKYLYEFREYRPNVFQLYLKDIDRQSENLYYAVQQLCGTEGLVLILRIHEQNYFFRSGHYQFVQKFIMSNTSYRKATGGSDIISYLPNQIYSVFGAMEECLTRLENLSYEGLKEERESYLNKKHLLDSQMEVLRSYKNNSQKEVNVKDAEQIYQKNFEHGLNDDQK
jgi:indoleamine 2,3-dioxygenase